MNIVIAGGTGFLGTKLASKLLRNKHSLVILTRSPLRAKEVTPPSVKIEPWDAATVGRWLSLIDGSDAVINLSGESIGGRRWSTSQKNSILQSRLSATKALVDAIGRSKKPPSVLVNASAVGYYGNVPGGEVSEDHAKGNDFLADVCSRWEFEAQTAEKYGVRVVLARTGIVLDENGGALQKLLVPFRLFVGGPLGGGNQWFPWIHIDDEIGSIAFALEGTGIAGPVNLAAPDPVTMSQFCRELGRAMKRPSWAPVPGFVLKTLLGEMAESLLLGGQRAVPKKLLAAGYIFRFPKLNEALANILRTPIARGS